MGERCVQDVSFSSCESNDVGKICLQWNCNSDCIHVLRSVVEVMTNRAKMDQLQSNRVCVAVGELFANISAHAYGGQAGKVELEVNIVAGSGEWRELVFDFRDYAALGWMGDVQEAAARQVDPEHLCPGGLGLKLIYSVSDRCEHDVLPDGNHWRLIFNIENVENGDDDGCTS